MAVPRTPKTIAALTGSLSRHTRRRLRSDSQGGDKRADRAQMVLLADEGLSLTEIGRRLGTAPERVKLWCDRFLEAGRAGLADKRRSGRPLSVLTDELLTRMGALLEGRLPPRGPHWTVRALAKALGVSVGTAFAALKRLNVKLRAANSRLRRSTRRRTRIGSPSLDLAAVFWARRDLALVFRQGPVNRGTGPPPCSLLSEALQEALDGLAAQVPRLRPLERSARLHDFLDEALCLTGPGRPLVVMSETTSSLLLARPPCELVKVPSVSKVARVAISWASVQEERSWGVSDGYEALRHDIQAAGTSAPFLAAPA